MILLYKRWGVPPRAVADALYRAAGFADLKCPMNWRASGAAWLRHGYCPKQLSYGVNQPVVSIKFTISVL
jgi:hypothetical protein